MRDQLQDAGGHLAPEVKEDAHGEVVGLGAGRVAAGALLQVHGPQLAKDEGVEQGAHVQHRCLGLLRKACHYHLMRMGKTSICFVAFNSIGLLTFQKQLFKSFVRLGY